MSTAAETPEQRLENLEKQLEKLARAHRYLAMFAVTFMMLAGILALGRFLDQRPGDKVLTANRFLLNNENGLTRASLAVEEDAARLRLFDGTAKSRAAVTVMADGTAGIAFLDNNDTMRVALAVNDGQPLLIFNDEKGKTRASFLLNKNGPSVNLNDASGMTRAELSVSKEGAGLQLLDEKGKAVFTKP